MMNPPFGREWKNEKNEVEKEPRTLSALISMEGAYMDSEYRDTV